MFRIMQYCGWRLSGAATWYPTIYAAANPPRPGEYRGKTDLPHLGSQLGARDSLSGVSPIYPTFPEFYMRAFKRCFTQVGLLKFPALCNIAAVF